MRSVGVRTRAVALLATVVTVGLHQAPARAATAVSEPTPPASHAVAAAQVVTPSPAPVALHDDGLVRRHGPRPPRPPRASIARIPTPDFRRWLRPVKPAPVTRTRRAPRVGLHVKRRRNEMLDGGIMPADATGGGGRSTHAAALRNTAGIAGAAYLDANNVVDVVAGPGATNTFVAWIAGSTIDGQTTSNLYINVRDAAGNDITPGGGCFQFASSATTVDYTAVACPIVYNGALYAQGLAIYAGDGNDTIKTTMGTSTMVPFNRPLWEYGEAGTDFLHASPGIGTTIDGGPDPDVIYGGPGGDVLVGGTGDDTFNMWDKDIVTGAYFAAGANDTIYGGDGNDTIDYTKVWSGIDVTPGSNLNPDGATIGNDVEIVQGTGGNDSFHGGNGVNERYEFHGNGGRDVYASGPDPDYFAGAPGAADLTNSSGGPADIVTYADNSLWAGGVSAGIGSYGPGGDFLDGNIDVLRGTEAHDHLVGNANPNLLVGRGGDDTLQAVGPGDLVYGDAGPSSTLPANEQEGNDTFFGDGTGANFYGGGGTDTMSYELITVGITASLGSPGRGPGGDRIAGDIEVLRGSQGNDVLSDSNDGRSETLQGSGGDDTFTPGPNSGVLQLDGGPGNNTVSYAGWNTGHGVFASLENAIGSDQFAWIQQLVGTQYDDHLVGGGGPALLVGMGGNDLLSVRPGGDSLVGDATPVAIYGVPAMVGGAGASDIADYSGMPGPVNVTIGGATSDGSFVRGDLELLVGTGYGDTLTGDANVNTIFGNGGTDTINGMGNTDYLYGDAAGLNGTDPIVVDNWSIPLYGGNGNDTIWGGAGNDFIRGGLGDDYLHGDDPAGATTGAANVDTMYWEPGHDLYDGGASNDIFDLRNATSPITINVGDGRYDSGIAPEGDNMQSSPGVDDFKGTGGDDIFRADPAAVAPNGSYFEGLAGNDTMYPGGGNDTFSGGDNRSFDPSKSGDGTESAGDGDQVIYLTTKDVVVSIDNIANDGPCGTAASTTSPTCSGGQVADNVMTDVETVLTGSGNDWIYGSNSNNDLVAGDGNDHVYGMGGNDMLEGDSGDDWLYGADGNQSTQPAYIGENDVLFGGFGDDHLYGENGTDYLNGGWGQDYLDPGTHDSRSDTINACDGNWLEDGSCEPLGQSDTVLCGHAADGSEQDEAYVDSDIDNVDSHCHVNGNVSTLALTLDGIEWDHAPYDTSRWNVAVTQFTNDWLGAQFAENRSFFDVEYQKELQIEVTKHLAEHLLKDLALKFFEDHVLLRFDGAHTAHNRSMRTAATTGPTVVITDYNHRLVAGSGCVYDGGNTYRLRCAADTAGVNLGDGNDTVTLSGDLPNAVIDGGAGTDSVKLDRPAGTNVNLSFDGQPDDGASNENMNVLNFENATGGAENDTFQGTTANNAFDGGLGFNTVSYADHTATQGVTVNVPGANAQTVNNGMPGVENDTLSNIESVIGGAGSDVINGSGGDDMIAGGGGNDTLDGEGGNNTLSFVDKNASQPVVMTLKSAPNATVTVTAGGGAPAETATYSNFINVVGGAGNDQITGDGRTNVLWGGPGDDVLKGGDSTDWLIGDDGNDTLDGQGGADLMYGGAGDDTITYASRPTGVKVTVGAGSDDGETINGVSEGDNVLSSPGVDTIVGTASADSLTGDGAAQRFVSGGGDDTMEGGDGADVFDSGDGYDKVVYNTTQSVNVVMNGTSHGGPAEGDQVHADVEEVDGGSGNDVFQGTTGAQRFDGGAGVNAVSYLDHLAPVKVALADGDTVSTDNGTFDAATGASTEHDSLVRIENVVGGWGNDDITGNTGVNRLSGGPGNDTLHGGNGNDLLVSDGGSDTFYGDGGYDTVSYDGYPWAVVARIPDAGLSTGNGIYMENDKIDSTVENLIGGTQNDWLEGNKYSNNLDGRNGDDTLVGNGGIDTLYGGNNNDKVYGDAGPIRPVDSSGAHVLPSGSSGVDFLYGGPGNDTLDSVDGGIDLVSCGGNSGDAALVDVNDNPTDCPPKATIGWGLGVTPPGVANVKGAAMTSAVPGRTDLVWVTPSSSGATTGTLMYMYANGTVWNSPIPVMYNVALQAPAIAPGPNATVAVSYTGTDGNAYLIKFGCTATGGCGVVPPRKLDHPYNQLFTGPTGITQLGTADTYAVFAEGADHKLWYSMVTPTMQVPWAAAQAGAPLLSAVPVNTALGPSTIAAANTNYPLGDVFVVGSDGNVWDGTLFCVSTGCVFTSWQSLGRPAGTTNLLRGAAVAYDGGMMRVFARDASDIVQERTHTNLLGWAPTWTKVRAGSNAAVPMTATSTGIGKFFTGVVDSTNTLQVMGYTARPAGT